MSVIARVTGRVHPSITRSGSCTRCAVGIRLQCPSIDSHIRRIAFIIRGILIDIGIDNKCRHINRFISCCPGQHFRSHGIDTLPLQGLYRQIHIQRIQLIRSKISHYVKVSLCLCQAPYLVSQNFGSTHRVTKCHGIHQLRSGRLQSLRLFNHCVRQIIVPRHILSHFRSHLQSRTKCFLCCRLGKQNTFIQLVIEIISILHQRSQKQIIRNQFLSICVHLVQVVYGIRNVIQSPFRQEYIITLFRIQGKTVRLTVINAINSQRIMQYDSLIQTVL